MTEEQAALPCGGRFAILQRIPMMASICLVILLVGGLCLPRGAMTRAETESSTVLAAQMPDMFCFTVMGVPSQEKPLLLGQQSKGKGLYQCPAHAVFGQVKEFPVTHALPEMQFGVDKGGKWSTALNTPVFKQIWQKVG